MSSIANDHQSGPPPAVTGQRRKPDPLLGRVVNGRFKVLSMIARGGMGKVYQAEQAPLGRICALKVLNPKYDGDEDPEFQRRFYLEASTASKLTHPNTVTIFDYGRDDELDIYFIAMEYVRGRTLFRILREDGPLAEHRVAHVMRQVGRSLREAHGLGVIHRDMKPANVVLTESTDDEDGVKVLDFGLVKDVSGEDQEDLTQQGLFMGSPKYMAPEQILGNPVSPATDIYSVGVVAYELLTGSVPFDKGTSVKTLMAHCNEAARPMRQVNPNVYLSGEMNSIVMRCLEKDPTVRYQSMDELLRALTKVEGGGTLTESLLAGPVVTPPGHVSHRDIRALVGGDASESSPTRPMARPSQSPGPHPAGSYPTPPSHQSAQHPRSAQHPAAAPHQSAQHPATAQRAPAPPARPAVPPPSSAVARSVASTVASGVHAHDALQSSDSMRLDSMQHDGMQPDSIRPGSLYPSATPEPMSQLLLDDLEPQKKSSAPIRVAIGAVAVVGIAVAAFSLTGGEDTSPAQASQASSSPAANETTAAAPRIRTVHITSEPKGARVKEGDKVVCGATPCDVTWRDAQATEAHELELSLEGHETKRISVAMDAKEISGSLDPEPKAPKTANQPRPRTGRVPRPAQTPTPKPPIQPPAKPKTLSGYKDSPY